MSNLTYAYASSNGDYHTIPIKSGQIQRISTHITNYYVTQHPNVRKVLSEELASLLLPHIDVQTSYDAATGYTRYRGTIGIAPLDTSTCILNDQYTYCNQHFTQAEIDYAISQTYPERFI